MFGPRKGHFFIIFDNVASILLPAILLVVVILRTGFQMDQMVEVIPIIIVLILTPIMKLLSYLCTTYQVTEEMMIVKKGLINKKEIQIPLETITTIDLSQNIIFQLAKVYKIRIETTVQYSGETNTSPTLALKGDFAMQFKTMLLKLKEEKIKEAFHRSQNEDKQNPQNIFDISTQSIDSGVVNCADDAVQMTSKADADFHMTGERISNAEVEAKGVKITPSVGEFILFAALKSKLIGIIILISGIFSLGPTLGKILIGENADSFISSLTTAGADRLTEGITSIGELGTTLIIFVLFGTALLTLIVGYLLATIISIIATLIRYLGFTVNRAKDKVHIHYGLLTKKNFTLTENKISGIVLSQSFLMRLFSVYTVSVYAIGYGGTEGDTGASSGVGMIYPLAKKDKIDKILKELFPEITAEEPYQREKQGTLRYFFYRPSVIFATILLAIAIIIGSILPLGIYSYLIIAIFTTVLVLTGINAALNYFNCKLSLGNKTISYIKGGFKKDIVYIKRDLIETVGFGTSMLKEKKGFGNLIIKFYGPMGFNEQKIINQNLEDYGRIKETIMY